MDLEVTIRNFIAEDDILKALSMVEGRENSSIILLRSQMTYIQTDGVTLDFQEGSLDCHYYCPTPLSTESIAEAFQSYARGDDWWKTAISWERGFG